MSVTELRLCACGCGARTKAKGRKWLRGHNRLSPPALDLVEVDANGCWLWQGTLTHDGYGMYRGARAHRSLYEYFVGPIPDGLVIDHLCRVRSCVNPEHLEPATVRENTLRGEGRAAINAVKTHCVHGHEFTPENTMRQKRGRLCRECHRLKLRRQRSERGRSTRG